MKAFSISVLLGLAIWSGAQAQGAASRPLRAPNVPNMRGTDSGQGPSCEQLTDYGAFQPPGPAATPYGLGAPAQAALPPEGSASCFATFYFR